LSYFIIQTITDVSPTTESTGVEFNGVSGIFPSQAGSGVLVFTSVGVNCTTKAVVRLDDSSCKIGDSNHLRIYTYVCMHMHILSLPKNI